MTKKLLIDCMVFNVVFQHYFRYITGASAPTHAFLQLFSQGLVFTNHSGYILGLVLQIFLYLDAFKCNTTSDWLNHAVYPIRSCVTFKFTNLSEKDKQYIFFIPLAAFPHTHH